MEPTLSSGDRLLTVRIYGHNRVKRQDIIAFYSREYEMVMVKRVIGLPGDSVTIQNDGFVIIDGKKLQENYVHFDNCRSGTFNVPENQFMLLGDNRKKSTDSRSWAEPFITEKDMLGRIVYRIYPLRRMKYLSANCIENARNEKIP